MSGKMQNIQVLIERAKELAASRNALILEEKEISAQLRAKTHKIYDVDKELNEIQETILRAIKEEIECQK
jgi:hypothetical protein